MAIKFGSVKGYYFLDSWVMAKIIQLSTFKFCQRFLNKNNDPCGRMFDQMTMAARCCPANIAEGMSRHQTSRETEMKLLDVARATLSELLDDYLFWTMIQNIEIWSKNSDQHQWVADLKLTRPKYGDDWTREVQQHILSEYAHFAPALDHNDISVAINANIILCNRLISMLDRMLQGHLSEFKEEGGFTENLTKERINSQQVKSMSQGAPLCPKCGKPMLLRTIKRGAKQGTQFWSCSSYPECDGTKNYFPPK